MAPFAYALCGNLQRGVGWAWAFVSVSEYISDIGIVCISDVDHLVLVSSIVTDFLKSHPAYVFLGMDILS